MQTGLSSHGEAIILGGVEDGELIALPNPFETRKLYLPDFSKGVGAAGPASARHAAAWRHDDDDEEAGGEGRDSPIRLTECICGRRDALSEKRKFQNKRPDSI